MNCKFQACLPTLLAVLIALSAAASRAAPITDFRTYRNTAATTLSGQGTDSPVVGNLSGSQASGSFTIGYLATPAVLGGNAGDSITFSFGVSFNDAVGMVNSGDNFRFALFDLNGEVQDSATGGVSSGPNYDAAGTENTDDFRGYILGVKNGTGTGSGGSIRERIAPLASANNAFATTGVNEASAPSLGPPVGGDSVTLVSDVNGNGAGADYTGVLTLTRNALGLIDLSGSFIGSNAATGNLFSASDLTPNLSSTYGAIGFLSGGPLNVDQVLFQNLDVTATAIPEPATWLLGLASLLGGSLIRRRYA